MAVEFLDKIVAFRQISQLRLGEILDTIGGCKDLVIDGALMKPLERFIGVKALKCHGVDKIFKLEKKEMSSTANYIIYFIKGDLITCKRVCDQINSINITAGRQFHLIAFPAFFHAMNVLVEEEGLYGRITLHSFHWELLSLDSRLFSFECPEVFKTTFLAKDGTYLAPCARSLWSLQHIYGKPKFKICIGSNSKIVNSIMASLDDSLGEPDMVNSDIGLLLIVDRSVDYVSTLLTPGTYTSLLSDVIGITTGAVQVPNKQDNKVSTTTTLLLTTEDETYNQIRHKHFSDVVLFLKQKIGQLYTDQAKRNNLTVQEMQNFVKNDLSKVALSGKTLSNHLHLCEKITNKIGNLFEKLQSCQQDILSGDSRHEVVTFIEDLISTGEDKHLVLRLICLLSICQNGLTHQEANSLKMQFFHVFGHEHIATFYNLERIGLMTMTVTIGGTDTSAKLANKVVQAVSIPRKSTFFATAAKLRLFPDATDDYSLKNPQDMGYVFGGIYIPLIAQIISSILRKEKALRELLKCLPGDFSEAHVEGKGIDGTPDVAPNCVWVYVVGGITYAEVAALALLEKRTGCRVMCSASSIINGNAVMHSAISS